MWHFRKSSYEDTIAESKLGEFFSGEPSEAIIREAFQNSLDAVKDQSEPVRISITFGTNDPSEFPVAYEEVYKHWGALGAKYSSDSPSDYMLIEDFNTKGLEGPVDKEETPHGSLYSFWWEEGRSKKKTGSGGSHGVGKSTLSSASQINTFMALSIREHEPESEILVGYSILPPHEVENIEYLGYARFGNKFSRGPEDRTVIYPYLGSQPKQAPMLTDFRAHAKLKRVNEPGLSIFIPRIRSEIERSSMILSIIRNFFFPIIRENLEVEIWDDQIDDCLAINKSSIFAIAEQEFEGNSDRDQVLALLRVALEASKIASQTGFFFTKADFEFSSDTGLSAEAFSETSINKMWEEYEAGTVVALRLEIPMKLSVGGTKLGYVDLYAKKSDEQNTKTYRAFRGNILIGREKCRASQPFETLILDIFNDGDGNELSEYMKYSEDPGHTEWKSSALRRSEGRYASTEYWQRHLVQKLGGSFISMLSGTDEKEQINNFADDIFYVEHQLPPEQNGLPKGKKGKKKGPEKPEIPDIPPPSPQIFSIRRDGEGRATVFGTDNLSEALQKAPDHAISAKLWAANIIFGKSKSNWKKAHHEADFDFRIDGMVHANNANVTNLNANELTFEINDPDFEIELYGFDPNRDVHIDVKKVREAGDDLS